MKNSLSLYLIRLFLLLIILSFSKKIYSQEITPHRLGELIIMLNPQESPKKSFTLGATEHKLTYRKTLSKRMNLHLYSYDESNIQGPAILKMTYAIPQVYMAQFNHILELRGSEEIEAIPDDPRFASQWNLNNTGQDGGLEDADIDAPEAWDITTGGQTTQGDEIVIAVIDEGMEVDHPDLNLWKNEAEIPDDGIDNDENGFIDDYHGWNAQDSNGELMPRNHAVHIAGIISAYGNNGLGISGINWNTKLMPIQGTSSNEATLMEAYGYVLEMRKRYNESAGTKGAFVVASNSSFGVNNGQAEDFPIWCALYDSLGHAGVLNVAATANQSIDVEISGDIPAKCSSDFLVITTNTNRQDELSSGAAYGTLSIDIGAPGTQILSTLINGSYGFLTGTSMATPHVTAAIGLLLSGACPSLVSQYKNDPTSTLLLLKDFLYQGVDTLPTLEGRTVSGGRLNIHKSLLLVQEYCNSLSDCVIPYSLQETQKLDISTRLNWANIDAANRYEVEFRPKGASDWTSFITDTNFLDAVDLQGCSFYQYRVRTLCEGDTSAFSSIKEFKTEGCCDPPLNFELLETLETSALVEWDPVFAANSYQLEYQVQGEDVWSEISTNDPSYLVTDLAECTTYLLRLKTICDAEISIYSDTLSFRTKECGFCIDTEYCETGGESTRLEWIEKVEIGPIVNESGDNQGYFHFDMPFWDFISEVPYDLTLTPKHQSSSFREYWRIWIDLNQDGDFEDDQELVYSFDEGFAQPLTGSLIIPVSATPGVTRLRVSMKGFVQIPSQLAQPCETFEFGEVEDYCINIITDPSFCATPWNLTSEITDFIHANLNWEGRFNSTGYLLRYREVGTSDWEEIQVGNTNTYILSDLKVCSIFEWQIAASCGNNQQSSFSDSQIFETGGCGACTDFEYCASKANNATEDWIQQIEIGNSINTSGSNGGFIFTEDAGINLNRSATIPIKLTPGFSGALFNEYWRIWIDWNHDGELDSLEMAFDAGLPSQEIVESSITVPDDALLGKTRMRITMKFFDVSNNGTPPTPCEEFSFGEVEDYCVQIGPPVNIEPSLDEEIKLYPNPFIEELHIQSPYSIDKVRLINGLGQTILHMQPKRQDVRLSTKGLPKGLYVVQFEVGGKQFARQVIKR